MDMEREFETTAEKEGFFLFISFNYKFSALIYLRATLSIIKTRHAVSQIHTSYFF